MRQLGIDYKNFSRWIESYHEMIIALENKKVHYSKNGYEYIYGDIYWYLEYDL